MVLYDSTFRTLCRVPATYFSCTIEPNRLHSHFPRLSRQLITPPCSRHPDIWSVFNWEEGMCSCPSSLSIFLCRIQRNIKCKIWLAIHLPLLYAHLSFLSVNRYISKLTHSLNHAIALSLKRNPRSPNAQYIRAVLLVKGVHFYGFHSSYSPFLKILVANPAYVNRAATILQSGSVMSTRFCVFESHLSYVLQFMCDFGLYGCGWLEAGSALQRSAEDMDTLNEDKVQFAPSPYFRQSRMPLEVDVIAPQILNRHRLSMRNLHHQLNIPAPPLPPEPLVLSVRELWEDERQRRRAHGLHPSPEIPLDPSDSSREPGGAWVAEARWWEELRIKMEKERSMEAPAPEGSTTGWERWTMSTFESVEALWETSWKVWQPARFPEPADDTIGGTSVSDGLSQTQWDGPEDLTGFDSEDIDIDVDISMISSQEISQMIEQEEADWARLMGDGHHNEDEGNEEDIDNEIEQEVDNVVLDSTTESSNGDEDIIRYVHQIPMLAYYAKNGGQACRIRSYLLTLIQLCPQQSKSDYKGVKCFFFRLMEA